jgi:DNA repair exonuclease SbcCD ATPase subunit
MKFQNEKEKAMKNEDEQIEKLLERQTALEVENARLSRRVDEIDDLITRQHKALQEAIATLTTVFELKLKRLPPPDPGKASTN